jgi:hypothetical protein
MPSLQTMSPRALKQLRIQARDAYFGELNAAKKASRPAEEKRHRQLAKEYAVLMDQCTVEIDRKEGTLHYGLVIGCAILFLLWAFIFYFPAHP